MEEQALCCRVKNFLWTWMVDPFIQKGGANPKGGATPGANAWGHPGGRQRPFSLSVLPLSLQNS